MSARRGPAPAPGAQLRGGDNPRNHAARGWLTAERSHRTDKDEFHQLLAYKGDVDLRKKLGGWESFCNYDRPHSALRGKTPYEVLREKLQ